MRDAVLMVVVAVITVMAIFGPRYGLMGYLWFATFRPDIFAYSPGRPYSVILAVVTAASSLRALPHAIELIRNPFIWIFAGYQAWSGLTVLMAQNVDLAVGPYRLFITTTAMVTLIPLLIRNWEHFRILMHVLAGSIGLLGGKLGLYGIIAGGAVFVQGYGGYLNDNNLVALAMVMGVPLLWYGFLDTHYLPLKAFYGFLLLTSFAAIAMCHSRGGILSLACVMVLMAWHSKRRVAGFVFIGLLSIPGAWLVRDTLIARMSTLSNVEDDESAMGRLAFWKAAYKISLDYPLFGVGFGSDNYVAIADSYIEGNFSSSRVVVHNTYFQMLADSGYPTLLMYCIFLFGCIHWLNRHSKAVKESHPEESMWAQALRISLIGFAVGSFFLSRVTYDFPYMLLLSAVTMYQIRVQSGEAGAAVTPDSQPFHERVETSAASALTAGLSQSSSPNLGEPSWRQMSARRRLRSKQNE